MSTPWSWSGGSGRQADEVGWSWKVTEMGQGTDKGGKRQERKEGRSYHDNWIHGDTDPSVYILVVPTGVQLSIKGIKHTFLVQFLFFIHATARRDT